MKQVWSEQEMLRSNIVGETLNSAFHKEEVWSNLVSLFSNSFDFSLRKCGVQSNNILLSFIELTKHIAIDSIQILHKNGGLE